MTSANERWTQRIMGGLGARPVGHAGGDPDEGPQIPEQSPVPAPAPAASRPPRLPDWWSPHRPHLTVTPDPDPEASDEDEHQGDDEQAEPVSKEQAAPAQAGTETAPVEDADTKRTTVRDRFADAADDRTMRVMCFNLTAGGVGYTLGLVDTLGRFLPAAEHGAVGMFGLFTAGAGAFAAWRCTRPDSVQRILPIPPLSRTVIACGAAEIGRQLAPVPVAWLNATGERWGLGPSAVSLLLTAGAMCGGLWWFVDRRTRHWHWTARWLFRIPLASALLATALYAPGTN